MSKNWFLPEQVEHYVTEVITRETPVSKRLAEETDTMTNYRNMRTSPDQVAFLAMLIKITGARRVLEIGTFTGYSALAMASALPEDGTLLCCDTSQEWADVGKRYWKEAGVDSKIDLRVAPALDTLKQLEAQSASFDMAFIDADKHNYDAYYEACLRVVRSGGIILLDNMLWGGAVPDPKNQEAATRILRTLNAKIRDDTRVDATLLTLADGIMLVRKQ